MLQYAYKYSGGMYMNKSKKADRMKRIICLILAVGMVLTAFMSLLGYFF